MKKVSYIRPQILAMVKSYMHSLAQGGLVTVAEEKEIIGQLKYISEKGGPLPEKITLKLISPREAASLLSIGYSNFKKLEGQGCFPFSRVMVGASVRYRTTDIYNYILRD